VNALPITSERSPKHYAAEHDTFLASIIAHPQMLELAHAVLGSDIRYDHCVDLSRAGSDPGQTWHTHSYADEQPQLGFVRIFYYVNGFMANDGGLRVVPGSHLFRHTRLRSATDEELNCAWLSGKTHPLTDKPLRMEDLEAPPGSVILMWTHALHAVSPRRPESDTRWAVVYAYRNPGVPSRARWISPEFEQSPPEGAESLMSLY
jgi:ectoine hydroxylase-related dioxygenase (phytanoyl-CoA dioxygenase family)